MIFQICFLITHSSMVFISLTNSWGNLQGNGSKYKISCHICLSRSAPSSPPPPPSPGFCVGKIFPTSLQFPFAIFQMRELLEECYSGVFNHLFPVNIAQLCVICFQNCSAFLCPSEPLTLWASGAAIQNSMFPTGVCGRNTHIRCPKWAQG